MYRRRYVLIDKTKKSANQQQRIFNSMLDDNTAERVQNLAASSPHKKLTLLWNFIERSYFLMVQHEFNKHLTL